MVLFNTKSGLDLTENEDLIEQVLSGFAVDNSKIICANLLQNDASEILRTDPKLIIDLVKMLEAYFWRKKPVKLDNPDLMKEPKKRPLSEEAWFLSDEENIITKLHKTAEVLKKITNSVGYVLYLVNETLDRLFICPKKWEMFYEPRFSWKIRAGKTIATFVVKHKKGLIVDTTNVDPRFPRGQELGDFFNTDILAVPLLDFDGTCIGVLELYRENEVPYEKGHLEFVSFMLKWVGEGIHQNKTKVIYENILNLTKELMNDMFERQMSDAEEAKSVYYKILSICKSYTHADIANLFFTQNEKTYKKATTNDLIKVDKRVQKLMIDKEILLANLTLHSGWMVNIGDVYKDSRFDHEVDIQSGYIIRSVLEAPIPGRKHRKGVLQILNKLRGGKSFNSVDEMLTSVCANLCGLWHFFKDIGDRLIYQRNITKELQDTLYHIINRKMLEAEIYNINQTKAIPSYLLNYSFQVETRYLYDMPRLLFIMLNSISGRELEPYSLYNFIYMVKMCYGEGSYFNFEISFMCTHFMFLFLHTYTDKFESKEKISLIFAIFCLRLDAEEVSLKDLKKAQDPKLAVYNDCIFERHSVMVMKLLIKTSDIFKTFSQDDQEEIMAMIEENILAANFKRHFEIRAELLVLIDNKTLDWKNSRHRYLLRTFVIMAGRLSVMAKQPALVGDIWKMTLMKVFYKHNSTTDDITKDLTDCNLVLIFAKFVELICIPCYELLRSFFPSTEPWYNGMIDSYKKALKEHPIGLDSLDEIDDL